MHKTSADRPSRLRRKFECATSCGWFLPSCTSGRRFSFPRTFISGHTLTPSGLMSFNVPGPSFLSIMCVVLSFTCLISVKQSGFFRCGSVIGRCCCFAVNLESQGDRTRG
ncbi:hypothetical protein BDM02DRAFT_2810987 [Thelephora ganbajun]|uniref:Uncharacterized protein n=1 Tax=Thelephora ganbajun TaxID=370292 RepID=A0ACB6YY74_THEGA|nr:hypothetical protein BDM02DRAFT_2810987 [Thelephora ganbajun]